MKIKENIGCITWVVSIAIAGIASLTTHNGVFIGVWLIFAVCFAGVSIAFAIGSSHH